MREGWSRSAARPARSNPLQLALFSPRDRSPGWDVRISRRARRLSLRVFPGGRVEVVVPPGVGVPAIERFVTRHRDWAERRAREFTLALPTAAADHWPQRIELTAIGCSWSVEYQAGPGPWVGEQTPGRLRVQVADPMDASQVGAALRHWLSGVAAAQLQRALESISVEYAIDYRRMQLRRQRTRWGSCSSTGTVSLNVCLMFQKAAVVRYLMIHELCHRRHLNHSPLFWQLVESLEPQWRTLDAELLDGWKRVPAWMFP